jgi:hypothetical protein
MDISFSLKTIGITFSPEPIHLIQDDIDHREASQNYRFATELFPMKDIHPADRLGITHSTKFPQSADS